MKKVIKQVVSHIAYCLNRSEQIRVCSINETIEALIGSERSLVRFGDGEITLIKGVDNKTQQMDAELGRRLAEILQFREDNLLVALPDIFAGLDQYRDSGKRFWEDHLLKGRAYYYRYCDPKKVYFNSFISRCYYLYRDKSECVQQFQKIRQIWANRDVVVVEGAMTHNGIGNDLLDRAHQVERILCPSTNAYVKYDLILESCLRLDRSKMILLSIGAAAKPLAYDLYQKGYRVIDIGNLDLEYEWFLQGQQDKVRLPKHTVIGEEANRAAGYEQYLEQILQVIE